MQGQVTHGWKAGYQKWTVPATGTYWIEAIGARGGIPNTTSAGRGALFGENSILLQVMNSHIVVGQAGGATLLRWWNGWGRRTFVVADTNNTPLLLQVVAVVLQRQNASMAMIRMARWSGWNQTVAERLAVRDKGGGGGGFLAMDHGT